MLGELQMRQCLLLEEGLENVKESTKDRLRRGAEDVGEKIDNAASDAKDKVSEGIGAAKDKVDDARRLKRTVGEKIDSTVDDAKSKTSETVSGDCAIVSLRSCLFICSSAKPRRVLTTPTRVFVVM